MKRSLITIMILVAGFSFTAENSENLLIPRNPSRHSEIGYKEKSGAGFSQAPQPIQSIGPFLETNPVVKHPEAVPIEDLASNKSHIYLRMNVMERNPGRKKALIPGIGLGYRRSFGSSALDFSAGYSKGGVGSLEGKSELVTLPKISYLYYFAPLQNQSLYFGPGMALGRIRMNHGRRFEGLIPSGSVGYELSRKGNILSFFQFDLSWPVIPARSHGPLLGVIGELSFGAGF